MNEGELKKGITDALEHGNLSLIKEIVTQHENVTNTLLGVSGGNVLHKAAEYGHVECLGYLIETCKMDLSCSDANGQTMFHYLASHGHMEALQFVLDHYRTDILIDQKDKDGCSAVDYATKHKSGEMVRLLMKYGADIRSVSSNVKKMYILLEDTISSIEILIDRVHELYKSREEIDNEGMKYICILIQMEVHCCEDLNLVLEKLSTAHRERLQELCSFKNVREFNDYAIIMKMMELYVTDPESNKNKSCFTKIKECCCCCCCCCNSESCSCFTKIKEGVNNLARGCFAKIGMYLNTNTNSHINTCQMVTRSTQILCIVLAVLHLFDIVTDFYIGITDLTVANLKVTMVTVLGALEFLIVFFCLSMENLLSMKYLRENEGFRLSLTKKKSISDLQSSDWEDTLNFKRETSCCSFRIRDQDGKLLKKSILFNVLAVLQLAPIINILMPLFHDKSPRYLVSISEANTKFILQPFVVAEQMPQILMQVYTLHMALLRDENVWTRVISLLIPALTIPLGLVSYEQCIREIDPSISELGSYFQYCILLVSYILTIPGRIFLLSSLFFLVVELKVTMHLGLIILVSYFVLRFVITFIYNYGNIDDYRVRVLDEESRHDINDFTSFMLFLWCIRDIYCIVSLRSSAGYVLLPANVTNKSIRSNLNILSRYFVMLLESIAVTALIEVGEPDQEYYKFV